MHFKIFIFICLIYFYFYYYLLLLCLDVHLLASVCLAPTEARKGNEILRSGVIDDVVGHIVVGT